MPERRRPAAQPSKGPPVRIFTLRSGDHSSLGGGDGRFARGERGGSGARGRSRSKSRSGARVSVGRSTDAEEALGVPARLHVKNSSVRSNGVVQERGTSQSHCGLERVNRHRQVWVQMHVFSPKARLAPPRAVGPQEGPFHSVSNRSRGLCYEGRRPPEF